MTCVNFVLRDGSTRTVEVCDGESLMKAAVRTGIPGIEGECGGEMTCATCHLHIGAPWKDRLPDASEDETDLLDMADNLTDESRLGCQVHVTAELGGLTATVATTKD